jgi:hypothetical protein
VNSFDEPVFSVRSLSCDRRLLASSCPSVRLYQRELRLADYMKFDIDFYKNLSRNSEHFSIRHVISYFLEAQSVYHVNRSACVAQK